MKLHTQSKVALLLAGEVTFLLAAPVVEASDGVETQSIAPSTSFGPIQSVSIPQFNPSLGTLESVTVDLVGTGEFVQKFENLSSSGSQILLTQSLQIFLGFGGQPSIPTLSTGTQLVQPGFNPAAFDGVLNFAAPSGGDTIVPVNVAATETFAKNSDQYILNWFTGQNSVSLVLSANTSSTAAEDAAAAVDDPIDAGADITVTYNYSAVPEPRTWAAASLILLGGAWLAQSRRRSPHLSPTTPR